MSDRYSRVSALFDPDELREATVYAWYKHIKGKHAVSICMKECFFSYMRKYAIPEATRVKLEAEYDKGLQDARAVQPELTERK